MSFAIINVYAFIEAQDRCALWKWCALSLPHVWLICGDFNMVVKSIDKPSQNPNKWASGERHAWYLMKNKLGLFDPNSCFSTGDFPEHLRYMWSNFQVGQARVLKCLDRAMLSKQREFSFSRRLPTVPLVETITGMIASDHLPIMFTILASTLPLNPSFS